MGEQKAPVPQVRGKRRSRPKSSGGIVFGLGSARLDRRAEDVRVLSVVVSELELVDVQREILRAACHERVHDSTAPRKTVDRGE